MLKSYKPVDVATVTCAHCGHKWVEVFQYVGMGEYVALISGEYTKCPECKAENVD